MQTSGPALILEDRQAIVDGTIRYCWAIDTRDWAELAQVFTEDAEADYGFMPTLRGLAEIEALVSRVLTPLDASQHMVTNHQIETHGGGVRSRCYFHAQHTRRGLEDGDNYVVAGIYRDKWSQTPAGWRIHARELEVLWTEGNAAVVGRAPVDS
jgi:3-phenylpropionate/cinnamic acid dioxygenase small subunit